MDTQTLPTRTPHATDKKAASEGLGLALVLHGAVLGGLIVAAYVAHSEHHWGSKDPTQGAVQASMVSALPLPPRAKPVEKEVLASEHPSDVPTPPPPAAESKPKAPAQPEPPPRPNDIPLASRVIPPKPVKAPDKPSPIAAATHPPVTPPPPTPKATTGDSGVQIPMSITQLKGGVSAITVDDRPFGDRYAYYIKLVAQKANQSKNQGAPDGPDAAGKRAIIRFTIQRDGTPTDIAVDTRSGSPGLDTDTLRAIQRIDSFGPLPAGNHLVIRYVYDSHPH